MRRKVAYGNCDAPDPNRTLSGLQPIVAIEPEVEGFSM